MQTDTSSGKSRKTSAFPPEKKGKSSKRIYRSATNSPYATLKDYKAIVALCTSIGVRPILIAKTKSQHSRQTFIVYSADASGKVETWIADTRSGFALNPYVWKDRPEDKIVQQSYSSVVQSILLSNAPDVYIAPGVLFKHLEEVEPI